MTGLKPKEVTVTTQDGEDKVYVLHRFPAVAGREIVAKYPLTAMPKLGDYAINEETMLKLMAYVGIKTPAGVQMLTTRALVDNHVPDWETLAKIEWGMLEYNTSFFTNGKASTLFAGFMPMLKALITSTLTDSLRALSPQTKQRTKNSKRSTT